MMIEYSNPWFQVVREGDFHWVEEPGATCGAAILPIVGDQVLLLMHQRPSQGGVMTWEIPRGYAEPGESARACARRELEEETGLKVEEDALVLLGSLRPNTAILASQVHLFSVSLPAGVVMHPADGEALAFDWMPLAELADWLSAGKLEDGFTLASIAYFLAFTPR